jgi:hypothetical protein
MAVPTTLAKFSDIQTTFGGSNPISISEYYKGGSYVPSNQATSGTDGTAIPTSGLIRVGEFRGLSKTAAGTIQTGSTLNDMSYYTLGVPSTVIFQSNGVIAGVTTGGNWILPTTTGIGSSYWIKFTQTFLQGGTVTTPGLNTWMTIGSNRTLATEYSYGNQVDATFTVQIAASSGGTVLSTWTVNLTYDGLA